MNDQAAVSTEQMIRAAAAALMMQPLALDMAGVDTALFVQTTRQIWREQGYRFSDSDIRRIHEELRQLVGQKVYDKMRQQGGRPA